MTRCVAGSIPFGRVQAGALALHLGHHIPSQPNIDKLAGFRDHTGKHLHPFDSNRQRCIRENNGQENPRRYDR